MSDAAWPGCALSFPPGGGETVWSLLEGDWAEVSKSKNTNPMDK